jgi:nitroreductase/NAD-dependent dihydropyrimidine dehydrogenase PreA subunit
MEKCTKCGQCIQDCPALCYYKNKTGEVVFNNNLGFCINCGHCIAVCPVNAIQSENLGEIEEFSANSNLQNINYQNFLQMVRSRRSIRQYKSDPVPKDLIDKVFTAMQYASSAHNDRNWIYTILSDPLKIKELSDTIAQELIHHPIWGIAFGEGIKSYLKLNKDPVFLKAPMIVFLSTNSETPLEGNNAGIALTYGQLAAHTLGLGSCWCGFAQLILRSNTELRKKYGIRGNIWGVITLGFPNVKYHRIAPRKPVKIKEAK